MVSVHWHAWYCLPTSLQARNRATSSQCVVTRTGAATTGGSSGAGVTLVLVACLVVALTVGGLLWRRKRRNARQTTPETYVTKEWEPEKYVKPKRHRRADKDTTIRQVAKLHESWPSLADVPALAATMGRDVWGAQESPEDRKRRKRKEKKEKKRKKRKESKSEARRREIRAAREAARHP